MKKAKAEKLVIERPDCIATITFEGFSPAVADKVNKMLADEIERKANRLEAVV